MPTFETIALLLLVGLTWLWWDSMQTRDIAVREATLVCSNEGLQLLDQTVAIAKFGFDRDGDGRLLPRRVYAFDYSDTGDNRRRGSIVMRGRKVLVINVGLQLAEAPRVLH